MSDETQTADKILEPGEVVAVPTKHPVTSYRWWGAVVAIVSWGLVVAVRKGWLPEVIREPVQELSLEVVAGIIGTLAALAGGWTASQPLGWSKVHVNKLVKTVALPALILPAVAGCTSTGQPMSQAAQLHLARQTHTAAANVASTLIERGVITDQATKDAIFYASREVLDGTEAAEAKLAAGDKVGFDFVMGRVQAALDRLAAINARAKRADTQPRSDAWTPRRLPPSFSPQRSSWRSSPPPPSALPLARSQPTTTGPRSRTPRPQLTPA